MILKKTFKIVKYTLLIILLVFIIIFIKEVAVSKRYLKIIKNDAEKYNVNTYTILAMIKTESNFNKNAISNKGAKGLLQLKEETALFIANKYNYSYDGDIYNVKNNLNLGIMYFDYLSKKFQYEDIAIASYNAGEGIVKKWQNEGYIIEDKILKIPYKETENYLKKVKFYKKFYTFIYGV